MSNHMIAHRDACFVFIEKASVRCVDKQQNGDSTRNGDCLANWSFSSEMEDNVTQCV